MIITDYTVTLVANNSARLDWSGDAGVTVRVFINGILRYGPATVDTADKSVTVSISDPCTIDIHETNATEDVDSTHIPLERKPRLWWSTHSLASSYRIYHGSKLLGTVRNEPSRLHHEYQASRDLRRDGGLWTSLRVEAVAGGRESTRSTFPFRAPGTIARPTGLDISGGAGVFDFEVISS